MIFRSSIQIIFSSIFILSGTNSASASYNNFSHQNLNGNYYPNQGNMGRQTFMGNNQSNMMGGQVQNTTHPFSQQGVNQQGMGTSHQSGHINLGYYQQGGHFFSNTGGPSQQQYYNQGNLGPQQTGNSNQFTSPFTNQNTQGTNFPQNINHLRNDNRRVKRYENTGNSNQVTPFSRSSNSERTDSFRNTTNSGHGNYLSSNAIPSKKVHSQYDDMGNTGYNTDYQQDYDRRETSRRIDTEYYNPQRTPSLNGSTLHAGMSDSSQQGMNHSENVKKPKSSSPDRLSRKVKKNYPYLARKERKKIVDLVNKTEGLSIKEAPKTLIKEISEERNIESSDLLVDKAYEHSIEEKTSLLDSIEIVDLEKSIIENYGDLFGENLREIATAIYFDELTLSEAIKKTFSYDIDEEMQDFFVRCILDQGATCKKALEIVGAMQKTETSQKRLTQDDRLQFIVDGELKKRGVNRSSKFRSSVINRINRGMSFENALEETYQIRGKKPARSKPEIKLVSYLEGDIEIDTIELLKLKNDLDRLDLKGHLSIKDMKQIYILFAYGEGSLLESVAAFVKRLSDLGDYENTNKQIRLLLNWKRF